jgi:hypothetical protein
MPFDASTFVLWGVLASNVQSFLIDRAICVCTTGIDERWETLRYENILGND